MDSPFNGTTGILRERSAFGCRLSVVGCRILITCPTVIEVFKLSISISFGLRFWTGSCFPVPRISSKRVYFIVIFSVISGKVFLLEAMDPESASAFVSDGSSSVSIARDPPGKACVIW